MSQDSQTSIAEVAEVLNPWFSTSENNLRSLSDVALCQQF